jgi:bifunctional non-homologous end joining protein LigD
VTPYSLRAGATPTASAPLTWDEVVAMATGEIPAVQFGAGDVLSRAEEHGDLLADLLQPGPAVPEQPMVVYNCSRTQF